MVDARVLVMAGCLLCALFDVHTAKAQGGRIAFTGAVVRRTCTAAVAPSVAAVAKARKHVARARPRRMTCAGSHGVSGSGVSYRRAVVPLTAATTPDDALLQYFVGNASATNHTRHILVVRTYE